MPSVLPNRVISRYESLLAALDDASVKANFGGVTYKRPIHSCFQHDARDRNRVNFQCFLHLRAWRARRSSRKELLDILLNVQEAIDRQPPHDLRMSTVRLSYLTVRDGAADLLHSVHFDYDPRLSTDGHQSDELIIHPLFHAQVTNEPVVPEEKDAAHLGFDLTIRTHNAPPFKDARIPTSDMTLSSVLLCLAADHLPAERFGGFMDKVIELQQEMPRPKCNDLLQCLGGEPRDLRSSHWFAHVRHHVVP